MPNIVGAVFVALALFIGGVAGFCHYRFTHKPRPVTIVYCEPSDTDLRCVEARKRYNAEHPAAAAPADSAAMPR